VGGGPYFLALDKDFFADCSQISGFVNFPYGPNDGRRSPRITNILLKFYRKGIICCIAAS